MAATKPRELLLSQLLTLHLDLAIKRYKGTPTMSKFLDLADDIKADLADFDQQADELQAFRRRNKARGDQIFADHRAVQETVGEGLRKMEAVLHDMGGSNSRKATPTEKDDAIKQPETPKLGEDSAVASETSFPTTDGNSGEKVG